MPKRYARRLGAQRTCIDITIECFSLEEDWRKVWPRSRQYGWPLAGEFRLLPGSHCHSRDSPRGYASQACAVHHRQRSGCQNAGSISITGKRGALPRQACQIRISHGRAFEQRYLPEKLHACSKKSRAISVQGASGQSYRLSVGNRQEHCPVPGAFAYPLRPLEPPRSASSFRRAPASRRLRSDRDLTFRLL